MNTESQQQIAREAADKHFDNWHADLNKETFAAIILSAIERATELTAVERAENKRNKAVVEAIAAAQPQRSEQQEWTKESVRELMVHRSDACQHLADAHNAELTAERQRREQADGFRERIREKLNAANASLQLKQQLLSALAAIDQYRWIIRGISAPKLGHAFRSCNKPCTGNPKQFCPTCLAKYSKTLESVDLSLLHEHDKRITDNVKEVRKPLVGDEWLTWSPQNIDNVLEKLIKIRGFVTQLLERRHELAKTQFMADTLYSTAKEMEKGNNE